MNLVGVAIGDGFTDPPNVGGCGGSCDSCSLGGVAMVVVVGVVVVFKMVVVEDKSEINSCGGCNGDGKSKRLC